MISLRYLPLLLLAPVLLLPACGIIKITPIKGKKPAWISVDGGKTWLGASSDEAAKALDSLSIPKERRPGGPAKEVP